MALPTTLTRVYNSLLALTLDKVRNKLTDAITSANALYFTYKDNGTWETVDSLGDRLRVPIMTEQTLGDSFAGLGPVETTPTDGITDAFYDWRQYATRIVIADIEKARNKGKEQIVSLLASRTQQAMSGAQEFFTRALAQGQGMIDTTSIASPRVSPVNGSSFIDPLGLLIKAVPSTGGTVGAIDPTVADNAFWRNQVVDSAATTYSGLLGELDHLINLCSQGAGGGPDLFVSDMGSHEVIKRALFTLNRFNDYKRADFPFQHLYLNGAPYVWDRYIPDAKTGSTSVTKGTLYAMTSKFCGVTVYSGANFTPGEFVRPENGAGEVSLVQWYGAHWTSRRDKQGLLMDIDLTIAA